MTLPMSHEYPYRRSSNFLGSRRECFGLLQRNHLICVAVDDQNRRKTRCDEIDRRDLRPKTCRPTSVSAREPKAPIRGDIAPLPTPSARGLAQIQEVSRKGKIHSFFLDSDALSSNHQRQMSTRPGSRDCKPMGIDTIPGCVVANDRTALNVENRVRNSEVPLIHETANTVYPRLRNTSHVS
jgi:hypothetical protein